MVSRLQDAKMTVKRIHSKTVCLSGDILATADQHADLLAVYGIGFALDILAGKAVLERRETPIDLITQEVLETL